MENNIIKAIDFMAPLHQHGLITDKEFSVLQKSDPPTLCDIEFKLIVYTPDREFALSYEYDRFNVFADGDLLEDFCINI